MSKEAMKLALEALEDIGDEWGFTSQRTVPKRKEAITALREALAEQPYEIGTRLAREGKGISDLWGAVKSDADMAEAQRGYEAALAEQPARPYRQLQDNGSKYFGESWDKAEQPAQQEPVAWMEMVVANLVREGVNKHKARELAQHFYTSPPAQRPWVGLTKDEVFAVSNTMPYGDRFDFADAIEDKLKEKNNG